MSKEQARKPYVIDVTRAFKAPALPVVTSTIIGGLAGPALLYLTERLRSVKRPYAFKLDSAPLYLSAALGGLSGYGIGNAISKGKQLDNIDGVRKDLDRTIRIFNNIEKQH